LLTKKLTEAEKRLARIEKGYERELIRAYTSSLKEVRGMIGLAYEKYGSSGSLSFAEMQKYNRLTDLEKNISEQVRIITSKNSLTLKKGLGEQFAESYYTTAYALESTVQAKLSYGLLNPKTIEASVNNPLDRVGFLQRNRDNQARLARQLREELTRGLIQGKGFQQTSREIKKRMDVGATNVLRIARTESHRVQSVGRLQSLKQASDVGVVIKKVWVATLDGRTRDTHQELDGVKIENDEQFEIRGVKAEGPGLFGIPAEDINCRCSVRAEIENYSPEFRRVRGEGIIPYTNYNDWKKNRL